MNRDENLHRDGVPLLSLEDSHQTVFEHQVLQALRSRDKWENENVLAHVVDERRKTEKSNNNEQQTVFDFRSHLLAAVAELKHRLKQTLKHVWSGFRPHAKLMIKFGKCEWYKSRTVCYENTQTGKPYSIHTPNLVSLPQWCFLYRSLRKILNSSRLIRRRTKDIENKNVFLLLLLRGNFFV